MKKIILIGGGGHCKSVIDVIEQEAKFEITGIVDKPKLLGSKVLGYPVIGSNVTTKEYIKIKKNSFIKAGSLIK